MVRFLEAGAKSKRKHFPSRKWTVTVLYGKYTSVIILNSL